MSAGDAQVIFTPSGRRGRFEPGTTVLDAARSLGVDLDSVCGGRGLCGRCQVVPAEGSFPKHGIESSDGHLSPRGADEAEYDRLRGLTAGRRLGCRAAIRADVLMGNDQDAGRWIRAHREAAAPLPVAAVAGGVAGAPVPIDSAGRPAGGRPRINRRALAAASAMRDAAGRPGAAGRNGTAA